MSEVTSDAYTRSFETFLAHTNEKEVLLKEIFRYINRYNPLSVIDIGAGNGTMSLPIAKKVPNYLAVERSAKYASRLRKKNVSVIESSFPVRIDAEADLVLMSHVISYETGRHVEMLSAAWELVAARGHLLIVTHRGEDDDWSQLLTSIGINSFNRYAIIFKEIQDTLRTYGQLEVNRIITTLETTNTSDMIEAMAFVAAAGRPEVYAHFVKKSGDLTKLIDKKYKTSTGYSFPFQHIFVSTRKTA